MLDRKKGIIGERYLIFFLLHYKKVIKLIPNNTTIIKMTTKPNSKITNNITKTKYIDTRNQNVC